MTQDPKAPAPSAGDDPYWIVPGEKYCLGCRKLGHYTNECWSTSGVNTPEDREIDRLCLRANDLIALTSQPPAVALVDERREPAVLRHALRFAEEIIKGQARYIDGPDMYYIDAAHLAENLRAALSPSGAESLGVKEQSQDVHSVEPGSGPLPPPSEASEGEFGAAAHLVSAVLLAKTNGDAMAAILGYRLATIEADRKRCAHPPVGAVRGRADDVHSVEAVYPRDFFSALRAIPVRDVLAERKRQIQGEGWTPEHDDEHDRREMALAAGAYAVVATTDAMPTEAPAWWPWSAEWWKPGGERRNLVKAGALILAEIERLDRAALVAGV